MKNDLTTGKMFGLIVLLPDGSTAGGYSDMVVTVFFITGS